MLKKILIAFTLSLLVLLGSYAVQSATSGNRSGERSTPNARLPTGTLQKMIVENGSVTMDLDLNGLNGSISLVARPVTLQFVIGANSFFPILVFNDLLRGPQPGSMALFPQVGANVPGYSNLPVALGASLKQLVVEELSSDQRYDLAVRDGNTGFTFFNVEGGDVQLRCQRAIAQHHERPASHFERVRQRARPPIRHRRNRWKNLSWRGDATDRDRLRR